MNLKNEEGIYHAIFLGNCIKNWNLKDNVYDVRDKVYGPNFVLTHGSEVQRCGS